MRTILIHSLTGSNDQMFNPDERDGYNDPNIYLRERLLQYGYVLRTADNNPLDSCDWVFFFDSASVKTYAGWRGLGRRIKTRLRGQKLVRDLFYECINAGMQNRIALFLWEGPAVLPENWDSKLHDLFPVIFTWHDAYVDNNRHYAD